MFDTLLASRSPVARRTGGTFVSVLVHTILIAGAAYGTSRPAVRSTTDGGADHLHARATDAGSSEA